MILNTRLHGYTEVWQQQLKKGLRSALWLIQWGTTVLPMTAGSTYLHGIWPHRKLHRQLYFTAVSGGKVICYNAST
jgi:hypothetical protein